MFTNIKCREIILSSANENWYIKLYDLISRLWYIATCGPFCKDATHMSFMKRIKMIMNRKIQCKQIYRPTKMVYERLLKY